MPIERVEVIILPRKSQSNVSQKESKNMLVFQTAVLVSSKTFVMFKSHFFIACMAVLALVAAACPEGVSSQASRTGARVVVLGFSGPQAGRAKSLLVDDLKKNNVQVVSESEYKSALRALSISGSPGDGDWAKIAERLKASAFISGRVSRQRRSWRLSVSVRGTDGSVVGSEGWGGSTTAAIFGVGRNGFSRLSPFFNTRPRSRLATGLTAGSASTSSGSTASSSTRTGQTQDLEEPPGQQTAAGQARIRAAREAEERRKREEEEALARAQRQREQEARDRVRQREEEARARAEAERAREAEGSRTTRQDERRASEDARASEGSGRRETRSSRRSSDDNTRYGDPEGDTYEECVDRGQDRCERRAKEDCRELDGTRDERNACEETQESECTEQAITICEQKFTELRAEDYEKCMDVQRPVCEERAIQDCADSETRSSKRECETREEETCMKSGAQRCEERMDDVYGRIGDQDLKERYETVRFSVNAGFLWRNISGRPFVDFDGSIEQEERARQIKSPGIGHFRLGFDLELYPGSFGRIQSLPYLGAHIAFQHTTGISISSCPNTDGVAMEGGVCEKEDLVRVPASSMELLLAARARYGWGDRKRNPELFLEVGYNLTTYTMPLRDVLGIYPGNLVPSMQYHAVQFGAGGSYGFTPEFHVGLFGAYRLGLTPGTDAKKFWGIKTGGFNGFNLVLDLKLIPTFITKDGLFTSFRLDYSYFSTNFRGQADCIELETGVCANEPWAEDESTGEVLGGFRSGVPDHFLRYTLNIGWTFL